MGVEVPLNVLIVHKEPGDRKLVEGILRSFGVQVHSLADSTQAAALVKKKKFDGIFLDAELPKLDGLELARHIRKSPSNRKAPIILITDEQSSIGLGDAFQAGVTFFLTRPIDQKKITHLLNATRGTMLSERRRYHRVPLEVPVGFSVAGRAGGGRSTNISCSGILFQGDGTLRPGETLELEFVLPGQREPMRAQGEVARVDEQQRVGVRFMRLAAADVERLQNFVGV